MIQQEDYGQKAVFKRANGVASCFQLCFDKAGKPAMNVDLAPNPDDKPNWKEKSSFQLTIDELSWFVAVLAGLSNDANFNYHGKQKNKSLSINRRQEEGGIVYAFNIIEKGHSKRYIKLSQIEAFRVHKLALKQLCAFYEQTEIEVMRSIDRFYKVN